MGYQPMLLPKTERVETNNINNRLYWWIISILPLKWQDKVNNMFNTKIEVVFEEIKIPLPPRNESRVKNSNKNLIYNSDLKCNFNIEPNEPFEFKEIQKVSEVVEDNKSYGITADEANKALYDFAVYTTHGNIDYSQQTIYHANKFNSTKEEQKQYYKIHTIQGDIELW